jgi:hypothetical protein
MKNIQWSGYEWLPREVWGEYHPKKLYCYYDPEAISCDKDENLVLKTHINPKIFNDKEISVGVGLISSIERFEYGYFEIEAKLPKGKNLWPAFWMSPFESWPPEIDVFEGYTKNRKNYFHFNWKNPLGFWRVETNFHCGKEPDNYNLGAKTHWLGFKDPTKHFNKYGCLWAQDKIEIFYNDKLVRKITDKKLLKEYHGKTMNVKINAHVDKNVDKENHKTSKYIIKNFKYQKL